MRTITIAMLTAAAFWFSPSVGSAAPAKGAVIGEAATIGQTVQMAHCKPHRHTFSSGLSRRRGSALSDIRLKHDLTLLGHLKNGLGYYRFSYNGSDQAFVGVMAQEVQSIRPDAVIRGHDGYLRVDYDMLGLRLMTWNRWVASGEKTPTPR